MLQLQRKITVAAAAAGSSKAPSINVEWRRYLSHQSARFLIKPAKITSKAPLPEKVRPTPPSAAEALIEIKRRSSRNN